ncbi:efflux RND transporter permease subunit [Chitinophaga polysaccharea]|uniref:efflux RND transporter permease subunit n=1 Tax=Chitinophaga polysaccharea TaxID=1293035 RepID=UPI0011593391|nr:efflux RND transporter permease subunit [Chitinophaga polysaccharea]
MFRTLLNSAPVIYTIFILLVSCGGTAPAKQPAQQSPSEPILSIQVQARYPGANAGTVLDSVAAPLKDSIFHYVENMDYMTYTASSNGSLTMTIYFTPGTQQDQAELDISNVLAATTGQLPSQVIQFGITIVRQNEPMVMAIDMYSENVRDYDQAFLTEYAATRIVPEIRRIPGVSHLITLTEHKDSLLRIWLNKDRMASFNLTLKALLAAIPAENLEAVTGILYKKSNRAFDYDYIIKYKSKRNQPAKYGDMPVHTNTGTVLKLKDVATKIEAGPYIYGNFTRIKNNPGVSMVVMPLAGSDYHKIQVAANKLMETASAKFPAGIKHLILYNPQDSLYISAE